MQRYLLVGLLVFGIFIFLTADVKADSKIFINKTIQNPHSSEFVDSLSMSDPKFVPGQDIIFRIVITNNENTAIKNISVKDILPAYITFVSGEGRFDASTKTLMIIVNDLRASESKTFTLNTRVVSDSQIPTIKGGVTCMINQAEVTLGDKLSKDNAMFCIEKKVSGAETKKDIQVYPPQKATATPATGSETIALLSLLPLGLVGFYLHQKSRPN